MDQLLSIPEVIFEPNVQVEVPNIAPYFPAVPSCKYYYVNRKGDKIAAPNTVGTPEEQILSLQIWYTINNNVIFPLKTVYAKTRQDQIGRVGLDRPPSDIAFSMKGWTKQFEDAADWFFDDRFQLLMGQMKQPSIDRFVSDFYKFPLNPISDAFEVARLLEEYFRSNDEELLRRYIKDRGVIHLVDHPFGYYPIYYLFFLLTRFASFPMTSVQLELAQKRVQTGFNSPARIFIDAVFDYQIYNIAEILQIVDLINTNGPLSVASVFGTNNPDWVRWADEYLMNKSKPAVPIENLANEVYILTEKLNTWTDLDIEQLCNRLKVTLPYRDQFPTRYSYVTNIAGLIRQFRSDPVDFAHWEQQVVQKTP